jgi:hypothetical protein
MRVRILGLLGTLAAVLAAAIAGGASLRSF